MLVLFLGANNMTTKEILVKAKNAASDVALLSVEQKNKALLKMADSIMNSADEILSANAEDVEAARGTLSEVMIDRLELNISRLEAISDSIRDVVALPDPVGRVLSSTETKEGLKIDKVSVPFGVTAMIYESRPNVTSDAAVLAFKSGNACVLRSGKEAFRSSAGIVKALKKALVECGINEDAISLIEDTSRQSATELMTANGFVDLLIPRGGAGLIKNCVENATVNCIETGTGICHVYVDEYADLNKAVKIIENAKMSRPSVCNAAEVCLVHSSVADKFLPLLKDRLAAELRLCERATKIIDGTKASDTDFDTEFLDYILAVKIVDSVDEAIDHIAKHSTGHSEAIVTENEQNANRFVTLVDSAAVYVNTSTRFTDGGVFGLGCEIGISTQKLHARGPMGLEALNTYKYIVRSDGLIR